MNRQFQYGLDKRVKILIFSLVIIALFLSIFQILIIFLNGRNQNDPHYRPKGKCDIIKTYIHKPFETSINSTSNPKLSAKFNGYFQIYTEQRDVDIMVYPHFSWIIEDSNQRQGIQHFWLEAECLTLKILIKDHKYMRMQLIDMYFPEYEFNKTDTDLTDEFIVEPQDIESNCVAPVLDAKVFYFTINVILANIKLEICS